MTTAGSILSLPINEIGELAPKSYVGLIDETAIECLKVRLGVQGLLSPIWVRKNGNAAKGKPYSVIAGRHRLRAAKALGWSHIDVEVRAGSSSGPDELLSLQVAENLDRRTLRPIEMSLHIMQRWDAVAPTVPLTAAANQQAEAIRKRWGVFATVANTPAAGNVQIDEGIAIKAQIDEATATACGVSIRKVQECRSIFEKLVLPFPEQFALLNAHPLGESRKAMIKIASLKSKDDRAKIVDLVLSRQEWTTISKVFETAGLKDSNGNRVDQRNHAAVMDTAFSAMKLREKRAYLDALPTKLTKEMARQLVVNLVEHHSL